MPEGDILYPEWCCLTCSAKFHFGKVIVGRHQYQCPVCRSANIHPAGGEFEEIPNYQGEIGTLQ